MPSGGNLSNTNPRWQASNLPPGFRLTSHRYLGNNQQDTYEHIVYSDGLAAVSVYVEDNSDGMEKDDLGINRMGTTHAYSRLTNGVLVTVMGDVPAITVQFIGEAVRLKSP